MRLYRSFKNRDGEREQVKLVNCLEEDLNKQNLNGSEDGVETL